MCPESPDTHKESRIWRRLVRPFPGGGGGEELIPTLGALFPRGGPVQDPVLTGGVVRNVKRWHFIAGQEDTGVPRA